MNPNIAQFRERTNERHGQCDLYEVITRLVSYHIFQTDEETPRSAQDHSQSTGHMREWTMQSFAMVAAHSKLSCSCEPSFSAKLHQKCLALAFDMPVVLFRIKTNAEDD